TPKTQMKPCNGCGLGVFRGDYLKSPITRHSQTVGSGEFGLADALDYAQWMPSLEYIQYISASIILY
ncbi:hypothetical protein, partial [Xanthomonas oryzae]